jgi:molybdenum cofactor guanylyltransferase
MPTPCRTRGCEDRRVEQIEGAGDGGAGETGEPDPGSTPEMTAATGVVLAGGRGSRLGGAKAMAELAGRPLIAYPLAALAAAGLDAFVVAKPGNDLRGRPYPPIAPERSTAKRVASGGRPLARTAGLGSTAGGGTGRRSIKGEGLQVGEGLEVEVVLERGTPVHPLAGIVAALRHAGRPVVVLGCDFPFVPPALLRALAEAPEPLVVPAPGGEAQPLVARWSPPLLPQLDGALAREEPLRRTVASLSPRLLDDAELARLGDPARVFFNVNTPDDLRAAAALV